MPIERPYVLSIAGFDPSAGAGVLSDLKCFEQHKVYGFGICTALTVQSDTDFLQNQWLPKEQIMAQLTPLLNKFPIAACKIGLIQNLDTLFAIITYIRSFNADVKIILDPILRATAGFEFHNWSNVLSQFIPVLKQLTLITPNENEMREMGGIDTQLVARQWAMYCAVLLKGGHNVKEPGTDYLVEQDNVLAFPPMFSAIHQKHGSGCVLSSSIVARLALGHPLAEACKLAKTYTEHFLNSNTSLLGYHS